MAELPPPPPMTSDEIVHIIFEQWVETLGVDPITADLRAEQGFKWLLEHDAIREWGFDRWGNTLYEPHTSPALTIVYVQRNWKE